MARAKQLTSEELKQQVRERTREVQVLHRISETICSTLEQATVLKQIVEVVVEVTKADACLLYLISETKEELILRASKNPHPRLIGRISIGLGEGITGWVAREKVPVVIPRNASDDARFKFFHRLPEDRYQAFVSVPIINKGEIVGVINVQHKRSKRYSEEALALLLTIANQVGGAIANARLYDDMREKARRLATLSQVSETVASNRMIEDVLQLIVTMTAQLMSSKICSIMLVDQESGELRITATQSLSEAYRRKPPLKVGQSMSGRAVQEQTPVYVPDVTAEGGYFYRDLAKREGLHSLLSVPMLMKNNVIGVINVYTSTHHLFSEEETKTLQAIANQSAVAIEHTRLMEKSFEMQEALEVRKQVERAKGFLMAAKGLSEPEAFRLMQRQSMNLRKSMREIADAIILAEELQQATQS
ncbi:MAG: GAF and ANTAR domain-containing protein [Nitrospirales bacterium]